MNFKHNIRNKMTSINLREKKSFDSVKKYSPWSHKQKSPLFYKINVFYPEKDMLYKNDK